MTQYNIQIFTGGLARAPPPLCADGHCPSTIRPLISCLLKAGRAHLVKPCTLCFHVDELGEWVAKSKNPQCFREPRGAVIERISRATLLSDRLMEQRTDAGRTVRCIGRTHELLVFVGVRMLCVKRLHHGKRDHTNAHGGCKALGPQVSL